MDVLRWPPREDLFPGRERREVANAEQSPEPAGNPIARHANQLVIAVKAHEHLTLLLGEVDHQAIQQQIGLREHLIRFRLERWEQRRVRAVLAAAVILVF